MDFEQAKAELEAEGYAPSRIRRMKCHMSNNGVLPVCEDKKDTPAATDKHGNFINEARIVRYRLNEGTLSEENKEFWIPCAMDGYQQWREFHCTPHWITDPEEQKAFCKKHYKKSTWPNHGEESDDPARWVNREKSVLGAFTKAPWDIPEKERARLETQLKNDAEIGKRYLCKAIELVLTFAPEHQQVSFKNLMDNEGISPYVDEKLPRIIELAFRAGQVAERSSTHYRGIPYMAQEAEPMIDKQAKQGARKEFTKRVGEIYREHSDWKPAQVSEQLKSESILAWTDGDDMPCAFEDAQNFTFYDGVTEDKNRTAYLKSLSRIRNEL